MEGSEFSEFLFVDSAHSGPCSKDAGLAFAGAASRPSRRGKGRPDTLSAVAAVGAGASMAGRRLHKRYAASFLGSPGSDGDVHPDHGSPIDFTSKFGKAHGGAVLDNYGNAPSSFTTAVVAKGQEQHHAAAEGHEGHEGAGAEEAVVHHNGTLTMDDGIAMAVFAMVSLVVGGVTFKLNKQAKPSEAEFQREIDETENPPTDNTAESMAYHISELSNELVMVLAEQGNHGACLERLTREIMKKDKINWKAAKRVAMDIDMANFRLMEKSANAYMFPIGAAMLSGVLAVPFVYERHIVEWFNTHYAMSEVPEPHDISSVWEVGAWSWNWMEPLMGTGSFVILCVQLTRGMMEDVGMLAWHERNKVAVADALTLAYPNYNMDIMRAFSKTADMHRERFVE